MIDINYLPLIIVLIFVAFDIISGVIKAIVTETMSSSVMRKGLWHKCGTIFLEVFAMFCSYVPILFDDIPNESLQVVYIAITAYIILMEISSVLENILIINPELSENKLFELFGIDHSKDKDNKPSNQELDTN